MTSSVTDGESSRFQAERAEAWRKYAIPDCQTPPATPSPPSPVFTVTEEFNDYRSTYSAPSIAELLELMEQHSQFIKRKQASTTN